MEKSHDIVNINLPKINSDTKEIINAIKRINPSDYPGIVNPENLFPQLAQEDNSSKTNQPATSDRHGVANVLLTINPNNQNGQNGHVSKFPTPKNGNEFSVEEFYAASKLWQASSESSVFFNFCVQSNFIPVKKVEHLKS